MFIELIYDKINLILLISATYFFSIILGGVLKRFKPFIIETFEKTEEQKNIKAKRIFGKYKEGIKKGKPKIILVCILMLFTVNLLRIIITFTFGSLLVLPLLYIFIDGMRKGASFFSIKGSSIFSIASYCSIVILEWLANIIGVAGGLNIFLSVVKAIKHNSVSLGKAAYGSFKELLIFYILIILVLLIQAVLETFYVKKVLPKKENVIPI